MIPYGRQWITEEDIAAVVDVLRSDLITQGPMSDAFEKTVADYCGAEYAVAVANGTAALHLAVMALGLGPGGLLWTSPITFVASANCARFVGADVDFVDIDPGTLNMSVDALAEKLETRREGRAPARRRRPGPLRGRVVRHGAHPRTRRPVRLQGPRGRRPRHRRPLPGRARGLVPLLRRRPPSASTRSRSSRPARAGSCSPTTQHSPSAPACFTRTGSRATSR